MSTVDRYLDYASHHDVKHKSAAATLINRSLRLPTSKDGKSRELFETRERRLALNGYPKSIISKVM